MLLTILVDVPVMFQNVLRMFQLCGVWAGRSRVIRGARWSARTKPTTEHQHIELSTTSRDSFHNIWRSAVTRQDTYAELAIKHGEPAWKWDGCLYLKSKVKPWWVALRIFVIWQPNCLFPKFRENSLTAVISTAQQPGWGEQSAPSGPIMRQSCYNLHPYSDLIVQTQ